MYNFFDTETTGLPKKWKAPMHDLDNWPRVLQLAWLVSDLNGAVLAEKKFLIRPDGWTVPDGSDGTDAAFWIEHGYTTEKCLAEGLPIAEVLNLFVADLATCEYLVSHNMSFDYNVLGAELIRAGVRGRKLPRICTKEASTDFCKIPFENARRWPGSRQSFKWPKLSELHLKLFGRDFDGAHDAGADVRALKECFFGLVFAGVIVPDKYVDDVLKDRNR